MEIEEKYKELIDKLNRGEKFGVFERSMNCFFQDGTQVSYKDLWKAVKLKHNIESAGTMSLAQLCPDNYVGSYSYKHTKHDWKKVRK